jgi:hypothetical protein
LQLSIPADREKTEAALLTAWRSIPKSTWPIICREGFIDIASSPLLAMSLYLEYGAYPPPAVMLWVRDQLEQYLSAQGKLSLEEAFFGKPKRRAGNFAAREHAGRRLFAWWFELGVQVEKGKSEIDAASEIVSREELKIEPESLLRQVRLYAQRRNKTRVIDPRQNSI